MKKRFLLAPLALFLHLNADAQELKNGTDSLSYAIGIDMANMLKMQKININPDVFAKAIKEHFAGSALMTPEESTSFLQDYFAPPEAKENKAKGRAFLNENKKNASVTTLPSGLQYQIIKEGTGPKPTLEDQVKVHYAGSTLDGNEFDSSIKRGEPATFGLQQVIRGWTEVLQLMPVGSKWKVFIPENLAYGVQAPPAIGPNQTLIFEIELLEIVK
ncbi:FKBP-type peptidyl-prolyl cis-trans isomerase [Leadbetterella byssophila]|uniref:Peptidyl-prolyl cis-trans isomerase n=1 Tax=Leadbetterella byssophila (strain DSM 17132 / JCM 16389 / KACC 11308 / NBRC 106382 / 4M15) TaxID=649349 RepID=E4RXY7_LEAB4|nr:FKBP-type peptidyl-prolyl cis-trans isomerase [Leadbetterella byssophila]ADQ19084.1 peptidylprolyl isomerase FKBP-type [Leadbetterella byssophila DSM 17132]